jgi:hypothetical protein
MTEKRETAPRYHVIEQGGRWIITSSRDPDLIWAGSHWTDKAQSGSQRRCTGDECARLGGVGIHFRTTVAPILDAANLPNSRVTHRHTSFLPCVRQL